MALALSKYKPILECSQEACFFSHPWGQPGLCLAWPCSAHLLCSGYGALCYILCSLQVRCEKSPVKLVPTALLNSTPVCANGPQTVLSKPPVAVPFCGIVPFALANALCLLLLARSIFGSWMFFGHCHFSRSLSLPCPLPFLEALLSPAISGQGTHLVIRVMFRTQKRNIPPSPCISGVVFLTVILEVCSLDLQHYHHLGAC